MDLLIPASKIANQNTGEMVGVVARENQDHYGKYETNTFKCKVNLDIAKIEKEKQNYLDLPKFYSFGTYENQDLFLLKFLKEIHNDIEQI
jgi:hypothetical protein